MLERRTAATQKTASIRITAGSIAAVLGGLAGCVAALAQDSAPLTVDVADCVKLESPADRLACFESQVAEAERAREPAEATPEPAAQRAASRAERRVESEAEAETAAPNEPARTGESAARSAGAESGESARTATEASIPVVGERRTEERESVEFMGTIAELRETIPDSYLITLANGQVWRQMRPKRYPLQPGYEVRIYSTRWGDSYRLSAPVLNGYIQVERVR